MILNDLRTKTTRPLASPKSGAISKHQPVGFTECSLRHPALLEIPYQFPALAIALDCLAVNSELMRRGHVTLSNGQTLFFETGSFRHISRKPKISRPVTLLNH